MAAVEQRIPSLDGLRALSIGLVLVGHAQFTIPIWQGSFLWRVVGNADLGVSIFFVISGFLITSLLLREQEKAGRISLTDFYIRRFFRIVPPFYAYLIAVVCLSVLGWIKLEWPGTVSAAAFASDYYRTGTWWLGQTWSLGVEEQFYLMWPALLKLLGRNRALKVSSAIICIAPAIRVLSYALFPAQRGYMVRMFHNRLDALMFGCTLALVYDHPAFVRFGRRWLKPAVAAGVCIFLFLASPALRSSSPWQK